MTAEREPRAWVLNLDAEHELEAPKRYAPTAHLRAIVARQREALLGTLVTTGDVVVDDSAAGELLAARLVVDERGRRRLDPCPVEDVRGMPGHAWSPTPRALRLLERAGATPPSASSVDVLRTVNARPFAAQVHDALGLETHAKNVVLDLDALLARLALPSELGWLVRRTFGAAGRGRMRLRSGRPTEHELKWLVASLRLGPLVVEPWVEITREYTRSGHVTPAGDVLVQAPCFQRTTDEGAWVTSVEAGSGEVERSDDASLGAAFEAAGRALAAAGYAGPFGVDAFRHRIAGTNRESLNPLSEINARWTMDANVPTGALSSRPGA